MGIGREIDGLRRRLTKIQPLIDPPKLRCIVQGADEPTPEGLTPWDLLIKIEAKKQAML